MPERRDNPSLGGVTYYMTGEASVQVHFPGDESLIGSIIDVYLEESKGFYYMGRQEV